MNELTPDEHKILVDAIQDSATVVHKGRKDMNERITCPHCGDTYPNFDVAHVCSKGPYAVKLKPKMKDDRLETLSDMIRKGQPIDFSEAIEVINYQENLKERKKNSFMYKVKRWIGVE
jgi:protein-arginine kinase activator protein McsA